jgi:hypothetical protein
MSCSYQIELGEKLLEHGYSQTEGGRGMAGLPYNVGRRSIRLTGLFKIVSKVSWLWLAPQKGSFSAMFSADQDIKYSVKDDDMLTVAGTCGKFR